MQKLHQLRRCRGEHRRGKLSGGAHQAGVQGHAPTRMRRRPGRLRRPVRSGRGGVQDGRYHNHRGHGRRGDQASRGPHHEETRIGGDRPGRHVRQRPHRRGGRAAVLPRLLRHREARRGGGRRRGPGHRRGLQAGGMRPDRGGDGRDAFDVRSRRLRPGGIQRGGSAQGEGAAEERGRGRRPARAAEQRNPQQRLQPGAQARGEGEPRLRVGVSLGRERRYRRGFAADADEDLRQVLPAPPGEGNADWPRAHHRGRPPGEPAAQPALRREGRDHRPPAPPERVSLDEADQRSGRLRDAQDVQLRHRDGADSQGGSRRRGEGAVAGGRGGRDLRSGLPLRATRPRGRAGGNEVLSRLNERRIHYTMHGRIN
mmetsp:Transcript_6849/g.14872  ORF Transcript_6849/g.14872 Transcript_6849/m.14872 type:complete len:370 (-) Transcript_6849:50-1159(-)